MSDEGKGCCGDTLPEESSVWPSMYPTPVHISMNFSCTGISKSITHVEEDVLADLLSVS
jgi:hypothetical protein